jgi:hypothetical protein
MALPSHPTIARDTGLKTFRFKGYIERQVLGRNGNNIDRVYYLPEDIGFLGYLNTKVPEEKIKERMDYFKDQARQLMEIRKFGHPPDYRT